ncbi:hypothetical protein BHE74_00046808 [Ensete ventricosum]|nr:hypothetical protein BHE74_00046808 [Ensete ventricosum]
MASQPFSISDAGCYLPVPDNAAASFLLPPDHNSKNSLLRTKYCATLGKRSQFQEVAQNSAVKRPRQGTPVSDISQAEKDVMPGKTKHRRVKLSKKRQENQISQLVVACDQRSCPLVSETSNNTIPEVEVQMTSQLYKEVAKGMVKEEPTEAKVLCRSDLVKGKKENLVDARSKILKQQLSVQRSLPFHLQCDKDGPSIVKPPKNGDASRKRKSTQGYQVSAESSDQFPVSWLGENQIMSLGTSRTCQEVAATKLQKEDTALDPVASVGTASMTSVSNSTLVQMERDGYELMNDPLEQYSSTTSDSSFSSSRHNGFSGVPLLPYGTANMDHPLRRVPTLDKSICTMHLHHFSHKKILLPTKMMSSFAVPRPQQLEALTSFGFMHQHIPNGRRSTTLDEDTLGNVNSAAFLSLIGLQQCPQQPQRILQSKVADGGTEDDVMCGEELGQISGSKNPCQQFLNRGTSQITQAVDIANSRLALGPGMDVGLGMGHTGNGPGMTLNLDHALGRSNVYPFQNRDKSLVHFNKPLMDLCNNTSDRQNQLHVDDLQQSLLQKLQHQQLQRLAPPELHNLPMIPAAATQSTRQAAALPPTITDSPSLSSKCFLSVRHHRSHQMCKHAFRALHRFPTLSNTTTTMDACQLFSFSSVQKPVLGCVNGDGELSLVGSANRAFLQTLVSSTLQPKSTVVTVLCSVEVFGHGMTTVADFTTVRHGQASCAHCCAHISMQSFFLVLIIGIVRGTYYSAPVSGVTTVGATVVFFHTGLRSVQALVYSGR